MDAWTTGGAIPHRNPRPEDRTAAAVEISLPPELCARIRSFAARVSVPARAVFAAAFLLYLSRICGQPRTGGDFAALCREAAARGPQPVRGAFVFSAAPPGDAPAELDPLLVMRVAELPGERYRMQLLYRKGYFAGGEAEVFARHVCRLLGEAASRAGAPLETLNDWPPEEERLALQGYCARMEPAEPAAARFERAAAAFPERTALVCGGERTTCRALDEAARRVAQALLGLGIGAGEPVALLLPPSPGLIAAILGALRAGCAFLPLDVSFPAERIRYILTDSGVRFCLTESDLDLPDGCRAVAPGAQLPPAAELCAHDAGPEALCCLFYVMGGSGKPESVRMPRRALDRLADPACSPFHRALMARGSVPAARSSVAGGRFLLSALPALCNGVAVALDGAEGGPDFCGFDLYGSEETGLLTACDGFPAAGAPLYVLAPDGRLLPPGAEGEIAAGGSGLASCADGFCWVGRTRALRTGDTGYLLPGGKLVRTGRRDRRILLKGERIEPAEIENRLAAAPGIGQCAALLRGGTLACFYTARREFSPEAARAHLARFLPPFALPQDIRRLPRMPLDEQGGVDYGALARLAPSAQENRPEPDAPEDDISLYDYRAIRKRLAHNRPPAPDGREELGTILLTGATGYLGAHILYELALKYDGAVYCLVRPEKELSAERRLKSRLFYYFETSFQSLIGGRIFVVEGDLSLRRGLPPVDTVINCAGQTSADAPGLYAANVEGVRRLIAFCRERGARLVQISSLGVAGFIPPHKKREGFTLGENGLYVGQSVADPYLKSKFLAERLVLEAVCAGLNAKILRLETLQGRYSDGEFQMNLSANRLTRQLRSCALTGVCPEEFAAAQIRFAPVDLAATAALLLARMPRRASVLHIVDEHSLPVPLFLERLERLGHPVRTLPDADFAEHIERLSRTPQGRAAAAGFRPVPAEEEGLVATPCVSGFSLECLHRFGFEWPQLAGGYLDRLMAGLDTFGFFG